MADDKKQRGGADRSRMSGSQGYEVRYFARKHRIPLQTARELVEKIGPNREKLNAAVKSLRPG